MAARQTIRLDTASAIVAHARKIVDARPGATDRTLVTAAAYQAMVVTEIATLFTGRDLSELSTERQAHNATLFQQAFMLAYQV